MIARIMISSTSILSAAPAMQPPAHSRSNPFLAELTRHDRLTGARSSKDVRHFVLNLADSGLTYSPGDSIGAYGSNSPALVDELIALLDLDPETGIKTLKGQPMTLRDALLREYVVNRANRKIVAALADRYPQGEERNRLMELVNNNELVSDYIDTRDYVDIMKEFPTARFETAGDFLEQLTPIAPRLYSVASSQLVHPGEAHLCVAVVRYDTHGRRKKGLASGFLADHADMFVRNVPVYVQPSRSFRLPPDPARDIIMCGPGTGIAPFRAFLEQREAEGATGRNWLFFGEQHEATDFLYQKELLGWRDQGILSRLDVAFSRDQPARLYVQHRMREQAKELWAWLQDGAYFYVCGNARHMAKDVHQTLCGIARDEGGLSPEAADQYVNVTLMKTERRYLRDVY